MKDVLNKFKALMDKRGGKKSENTSANSAVEIPTEDVGDTTQTSWQKLSSFVSEKTQQLGPERLKNFEWDGLIENLFSPNSRKEIHKLFILTTIGTCSFVGGKFIALGISSMTIKDKNAPAKAITHPIVTYNYRSQLNLIRDANLFNAKLNESGTVAKKIQVNVKCYTADTPSSLPLQLLSTTVLQDKYKSLASLQKQGGDEISHLRVEDKIEGLVEIGFIDRQKVVIKNLETGECEYLSNEEKGSRDNKFTVVDEVTGKKLLAKNKDNNIRNEGNKLIIKKKFREEMLKDINQYLTQARAVPLPPNPDGSIHYKMTEIVPGSIYSRLGIRENDIITGIDGKKIKNLNEIMQYFGRFREIDSIQITVQRDGNEERLEYLFE